jgi:tetratricopeptide (TPR) repeat protein
MTMGEMRGVCRLSVLTAALLLPLLAASPPLEQARKLYELTDYDASLKILHGIQPKDGPVLELTGRNHFMLGDYKKATEVLEKALAAEPSNSDYALWLGRAFGRRAETSTIFTAPANAAKARQFFEKAVELNARNMEAMGDLFDYYLEAPGFLGGGLDKAAALAGRISDIEPAEGQWALARLAERRKEYDTAEHHLRSAAEMAPQQVGRLIELARFLARQGRYSESEQKFKTAEKLDPNNPRLMYARADVYVTEHRNLDEAKRLLKRYLAAQLSPDDPPRAQAEKLLKQASGG